LTPAPIFCLEDHIGMGN